MNLNNRSAMARYLYICECVHQENHFCSVLFFDVKDISNVKGGGGCLQAPFMFFWKV